MKYLRKSQTVEEFNEILKEGLKNGFILSDPNDIKLIIELAYNLNYYLTYFIEAYGKENSN